ncbi:hypothetical protein INR49_005867 [Caranx melampygus]|nr:hypothetical protein INR49_005867 [Caranx melampygus]
MQEGQSECCSSCDLTSPSCSPEKEEVFLPRPLPLLLPPRFHSPQSVNSLISHRVNERLGAEPVKRSAAPAASAFAPDQTRIWTLSCGRWCRSVTITPVSVLSVMVYFNPGTVDMEVTNLINITNNNFVPVQIVEFDVQSLVIDIVVGKTKISNMTAIQSRSEKSYIIKVDLPIIDKGLKMTMNISYLSHTEQLSYNTFEYIDCGTNSTIPHPSSLFRSAQCCWRRAEQSRSGCDHRDYRRLFGLWTGLFLVDDAVTARAEGLHTI